jgi:hypothetical protein
LIKTFLLIFGKQKIFPALNARNFKVGHCLFPLYAKSIIRRKFNTEKVTS